MTQQQIAAYLETLAKCEARHLVAGDRINAPSGFDTVKSVNVAPAGTREIVLESGPSFLVCMFDYVYLFNGEGV